MNVTLEGETVPSVTSELEIPTLTSAVGWLRSTIVNEADPPASLVTRPAVGLTVNPATSLSVLVTDTLGGSTPSYPGSPLVAAAVVIV